MGSCAARVWALVVCAAPLCAQAWPADVYVDLEAGGQKVERPSAVEWVEVEDAKVATAQIQPSGELLLLGQKPGRTLLLLYAEGKFAVWRLRVSSKTEKPKPVLADEALPAAQKACPGLALHPDDEKQPHLEVAAKDERCRQALLALFQTDAFVARQLDIDFELTVLQSQLGAIDTGLAAGGLKKIQTSYLGAGLVLKGEVTAPEHKKALWEIFRRSVGRVPLDDQLELK